MANVAYFDTLIGSGSSGAIHSDLGSDVKDVITFGYAKRNDGAGGIISATLPQDLLLGFKTSIHHPHFGA